MAMKENHVGCIADMKITAGRTNYLYESIQEKQMDFDENSSIEANFNLRNKDGEYNLLAELLADKNNIPFIFVKFSGVDKAAISERNDYGYGCILSVYEK